MSRVIGRRIDKFKIARCPKCGRYMDKITAWVCKKCGKLKKRG